MTYHEKVRRNELSCERQMMTLIERRIKDLERENERLRLWKEGAINFYPDLERMKIHDTTLTYPRMSGKE